MLVQIVYLGRCLFVETTYSQKDSTHVYVMKASYSDKNEEKIFVDNRIVNVSVNNKIQSEEGEKILLNNAFFASFGRMNINYLIPIPGFGSLGTHPSVKMTDNTVEFSLSLDHLCDPDKPFMASTKYMNADSNLNFGVFFLISCTFKQRFPGFQKLKIEEEASMIEDSFQYENNLWEMVDIDLEHLYIEVQILEHLIKELIKNKFSTSEQTFIVGEKGIFIENIGQNNEESNKYLLEKKATLLQYEKIIKSFEDTYKSYTTLDNNYCRQMITKTLKNIEPVATLKLPEFEVKKEEKKNPAELFNKDFFADVFKMVSDGLKELTKTENSLLI